MSKKARYVITDHMCRECGGRVLQQVAGGGPSGGGNPLYRCADCGIAACGMGPQVICWCGFKHRLQADKPYRCVAFAGNEELHTEMAKCGCVPGKHEIGIILISK